MNFWKRTSGKGADKGKKLAILIDLSFGEYIAEQEQEDLDSYFYGTSIWKDMLDGTFDIVFGAKGSGKSALAAQLSQSRELSSKGTTVIFGENPQGQTAFQEVALNPPSKEDFKVLWKLHILTLAARFIRDEGLDNNENGRRLVASLEKVNLLPREASIIDSLRAVRAYISLQRSEIELAVADDISPPGQPKFTGTDGLLLLANKALDAANQSCWIILDRLDVAFRETIDVEKDAIRTLLRAYSNMDVCKRLRPKIFLREDIWKKMTEEGMIEATHILSRRVIIKWTPDILLQVVVRRALVNEAVREYYEISDGSDYLSTQRQLAFLSDMLPNYIERTSPFEWILQNTCDALSPPMPREMIHLFMVAKRKQIEDLRKGIAEPEGTKLFSESAFIKALQEVSEARLNEMLYAEYSVVQKPAEKLRGTENLYTVESLCSYWSMDLKEVEAIAKVLVQTGFFAVKLDKAPRYQIAPIYRPALGVYPP